MDGDKIIEYSLAFSYGFLSVIFVLIGVNFICSITGCQHYSLGGFCVFPAEVYAVFGYLGFLIPAFGSYMRNRNFEFSVLVGVASLIAVILASLIALFTSEFCSLFASVVVGIVSIFIMSSGSLLIEYNPKHVRVHPLILPEIHHPLKMAKSRVVRKISKRIKKVKKKRKR